MFPSGPEPLDFYEAVVHATRDTLPLVAALRPDVVVADILTLAPALAAEIEGMPCATLIPHVFPEGAPGLPIYSLGARLPRTAVGRAFWRRAGRPLEHGLQLGRAQLNDVRARLGLPRFGLHPRRHQPRAGAGRNVSPARVPALVAFIRPCRRSADVGAPSRGRGATAGRCAARARGTLDRPGPVAPDAPCRFAGTG